MRDVVLDGVIGNDVESVGRLDLKGVDLFDGFRAMSVIHASANEEDDQIQAQKYDGYDTAQEDTESVPPFALNQGAEE